jgi:hypothetical protein
VSAPVDIRTWRLCFLDTIYVGLYEGGRLLNPLVVAMSQRPGPNGGMMMARILLPPSLLSVPYIVVAEDQPYTVVGDLPEAEVRELTALVAQAEETKMRMRMQAAGIALPGVGR